jgi:monoamine oxidase
MSRFSESNSLKAAYDSAVGEDPALKVKIEERQWKRRAFLGQAAFAAGALLTTPWLAEAARKALSHTGMPVGGRGLYLGEAGLPVGDLRDNRVVIVGAGIAGLNACYQLKKQGIEATLYEGSSRVGGRMFTLKDKMGPGITTDLGGEYVDNTHEDIIALVGELGLSLYDLREDPLVPKTYYFGGRERSQEDLKAALAPFVPRLVADIHSLPTVISHETADQFRHLDEQSITEYLKGIGVSGWLYDYLNVTLTREYGMEASEQSAVNFLIMFEAPTGKEKNYELFGQDHEIAKIKGGSQQLTDALYAKIAGQVKLEHGLTGISGSQEQGYQLDFVVDGQARQVEADYVLLALPFTILRNLHWGMDMPAQKWTCIKEIGYGNSCKFVLGMDGKPWRKAGKRGYTFTDLGFGCGWDSSQHQSEVSGGFTVFGGGDFGDTMAALNKTSLINQYLPGLDAIYPGCLEAFNQQTIQYCWSQNPFVKAGYSSFRKGQWSTLAGWEAVPVGKVYFAGEHVSRDFQGYMNGGAQTARVAVEAMVQQMLAKK